MVCVHQRSCQKATLDSLPTWKVMPCQNVRSRDHIFPEGQHIRTIPSLSRLGSLPWTILATDYILQGATRSSDK